MRERVKEAIQVLLFGNASLLLVSLTYTGEFFRSGFLI